VDKRNKKNTRKLDYKTFYAVINRFKRMRTSLCKESKKLGFHHDLGKRALLGETRGEVSLKRKELLIRVSKGLTIETEAQELEPETTTGEPT